MEGPPPQITAKSVDDYLEQLSKPVFQAGMSWRVVDAKWTGIRKGFHNFKAERVARMSDREVDTLTTDEKMIRSRPKIAAVVHNANALLDLERGGGIKKHLRSFDEYEDLATDLKKRFKFVGDSRMYHFLWTVKQPVPAWHGRARSRSHRWVPRSAWPSASAGKRSCRPRRACSARRSRHDPHQS